MPFGWVLATVGYYGPWIAHKAAALTLTGSDMGEFVKFLPDVLDGSLRLVRQFFYLPPIAVALSVALLVGSRSLGYSWLLRGAILALAAVASIQLLPPAWSPVSLMTSEFCLQPIALGLCWLALGGFWFLGRLPLRATGLVSCGVAAVASILSIWQFLNVKSTIDMTYDALPAPAVGWGCVVCIIGLAVLTSTGAALVLLAGNRKLVDISTIKR